MSSDLPNLYLCQPKMSGPAVTRFQELASLVPWVGAITADGVFGFGAYNAAKQVQKTFGLVQDGVVGPQTWAKLLAYVDLYADDPKFLTTPDRPYEGIVDLRNKHERARHFKCRRRLDTVSGIVLHQTGCTMPEKAEGWARLNAHIGINRDGTVILVNDFADWIWHAQGLSATTIGVEIAGNYPGLIGHPASLWKPGGGPHSLTPEMKRGMAIALTWIDTECARLGIIIKGVYAHRQAKNTRQADPGEEIWMAAGIPWQAHFGVTDGGNDFKVGTGAPIPKEWDSRRTRRYWF